MSFHGVAKSLHHRPAAAFSKVHKKTCPQTNGQVLGESFSG
jgi:hypothetical protein